MADGDKDNEFDVIDADLDDPNLDFNKLLQLVMKIDRLHRSVFRSSASWENNERVEKVVQDIARFVNEGKILWAMIYLRVLINSNVTAVGAVLIENFNRSVAGHAQDLEALDLVNLGLDKDKNGNVKKH